MDTTSLYGGQEIGVEYRDGGKESVFVRQLDLDDMPKYLRVAGNEPRAIELFCAKEEGWSKSLTPQSFDAVIEKGEEMNLPLLERFYRRLERREQVFNPGMQEKRKAAMEDAVQRAAERAAKEFQLHASASESPAATA